MSKTRTQIVQQYVDSLVFGKRYYRPAGYTWRELEIVIPEHTAHRGMFVLHQLRGDMFCLECKHCGGTET